jgi:hypothetical protein
MAVWSDWGRLLSPASEKFSYPKPMYMFTRLHGISSYTTVFYIQTYWAAFIYIYFYWRTFREMTLFRLQMLNLHYTDTFSITVCCIVRVVKSRRMGWAGHMARMGEDRGVYRVLVGKPEGKRPLVRPRRRWEDNIKMDLQEVGWGRGDWMELAEDRDRWRALVGTVRNFWVS